MVQQPVSEYHLAVFSSQDTEPTMDFRLIARLLVPLLIVFLLQGCAGRDAALREDALSGKSVHAGQQADVDFDERFSGEGELRTRRVTATAYNSLPRQTDSRPNEAAWGDTLDEAMRAIPGNIRAMIEARRAHGEALPEVLADSDLLSPLVLQVAFA